MSEQEREELERKDVQHAPHKLKGSREDLKKNPPERLVKKRRRRRRRRKKRQKVQLITLLAIFLFAAFVAVYLMHDHYVRYPGILERDTIRIMGRGNNYIAIRWNRSRNTDEYEVYFKEYIRGAEPDGAAQNDEVSIDGSWEKRTTEGNEIQLSGLKESSYYSFILRPVNEYMEGKFTRARTFSTKRTQRLKVNKHITKLTVNKPFKIEANASTTLAFTSSDRNVADIDPKTGEIVLKSAGTTKITVQAREDNQFSAASEVVQLDVIDGISVNAGGANSQTIYHLSPDNCELVKSIQGADGAMVPQGLAYTGDKYIVAYGMGSPNRIVSFDTEGEGKEISIPKTDLGKPNGFAYADENKTCYCVKGWSSRAVTFKPDTGEYGALNLSYGCSGIGYDRKAKLLYTSSRTAMVAYDISDGYSVKYRTGVVRHAGTTFTQDCGGHGGILLRCLSDSSKHGVNFIDLYDMKHGKYLGTISCDLSEVESVIVNREGYMEIMANNTSNTDYIWRTNINIETIAEGLPK